MGSADVQRALIPSNHSTDEKPLRQTEPQGKYLFCGCRSELAGTAGGGRERQMFGSGQKHGHTQEHRYGNSQFTGGLVEAGAGSHSLSLEQR